MELGCKSSNHDVLDSSAVERIDDFEWIEVLAAHACFLFAFRTRRAADTALSSFATRADW
jgi:hypothetical protein